jgi:predicted peroxiredoxin
MMLFLLCKCLPTEKITSFNINLFTIISGSAMKKQLSILLILSFCLSINLFSQEKTSETKDGMLIHITHSYDDPHRAVMGLKMATIMAEDKDVLVYLDIKGVEFVLKDAKDISYPTFPSAHESIKQLLKNDVTIFACPGCLKAIGKTGEDLMDGIKVAEKDKFFNFTDGKIVTLDY